MLNPKLYFFFLLVIGVMFTSCDDDDNNPDPPANTFSTLVFNGTNLDDLGDQFAYEGWVVIDGTPVSTGILETTTAGMNLVAASQSFTLRDDSLDMVDAYVVSIEPVPDMDPAPSATKILAGPIDVVTEVTGAPITMDHAIALGTDFSDATGRFILATPTDGNSDTNESSGVWFLNPNPGPMPVAGLDLPTLGDGWRYEGWAVIDGIPVSTGRFQSPTGADDASTYSGTQAEAPGFPGEDFLVNAPEGLVFPTSLAEKTIVISLEPYPDNSPAPFSVKPLVFLLAEDADPSFNPFLMDNNINIFDIPQGVVELSN